MPTTAEAPTPPTPPAAEQLHCCFIPEDELADFEAAESAADVVGKGCPKPAEFEIRDLEERHPECGITHACVDHVGRLLGHDDAGTWQEGEEERWEVQPV